MTDVINDIDARLSITEKEVATLTHINHTFIIDVISMLDNNQLLRLLFEKNIPEQYKEHMKRILKERTDSSAA